MHGSGEEIANDFRTLGICLETRNGTQESNGDVEAIRPNVLHSRKHSRSFNGFHYTLEVFYCFDPIFETVKVLSFKFSHTRQKIRRTRTGNRPVYSVLSTFVDKGCAPAISATASTKRYPQITENKRVANTELRRS
jgi:hypothetical protein